MHQNNFILYLFLIFGLISCQQDKKGKTTHFFRVTKPQILDAFSEVKKEKASILDTISFFTNENFLSTVALNLKVESICDKKTEYKKITHWKALPKYNIYELISLSNLLEDKKSIHCQFFVEFINRAKTKKLEFSMNLSLSEVETNAKLSGLTLKQLAQSKYQTKIICNDFHNILTEQNLKSNLVNDNKTSELVSIEAMQQQTCRLLYLNKNQVVKISQLFTWNPTQAKASIELLSFKPASKNFKIYPIVHFSAEVIYRVTNLSETDIHFKVTKMINKLKSITRVGSTKGAFFKTFATLDWYFDGLPFKQDFYKIRSNDSAILSAQINIPLFCLNGNTNYRRKYFAGVILKTEDLKSMEFEISKKNNTAISKINLTYNQPYQRIFNPLHFENVPNFENFPKMFEQTDQFKSCF